MVKKPTDTAFTVRFNLDEIVLALNTLWEAIKGTSYSHCIIYYCSLVLGTSRTVVGYGGNICIF